MANFIPVPVRLIIEAAVKGDRFKCAGETFTIQTVSFYPEVEEVSIKALSDENPENFRVLYFQTYSDDIPFLPKDWARWNNRVHTAITIRQNRIAKYERLAQAFTPKIEAS